MLKISKETGLVISDIAKIQLVALQELLLLKIQKIDTHNILTYLEIEDPKADIDSIIDERIKLWSDICKKPQILTDPKRVSSYQLGICQHILFIMEETWVQTNVEGVNGLWNLFDKLYKRDHPELNNLIIYKFMPPLWTKN